MLSSLWQPFNITLVGTPWRGVSSKSLAADRRFALKARTKTAIKTVPGARRIARQNIQLPTSSQHQYLFHVKALLKCPLSYLIKNVPFFVFGFALCCRWPGPERSPAEPAGRRA